MQHLVQVKVLLLDMEKSQSALIAIKGIWVLEVIERRVFPVWKH